MKIPYALVAAMDVKVRHQQMLIAIQHEPRYPRLKPVPIEDGRSLTIACYGPSLADTWSTMTRPILSMSGATRFLADRGLVPDYHIDMDPRPHKIKHLDPPIPGVQYLMASVCPPQTWDLLKDQHVTIWHAFSGKERDTGRDTLDWLGQYDPGEQMIHGGSSIGLAALHVGGCLGYRHFEIHGMDGSSRHDQRHAGPHYGHAQGGITWAAGGVTYQTSRIMSNGITEMLNMIDHFPMCCVFHGDGLMQALVREKQADSACCADDMLKANRLRKTPIHIVADVPGGFSSTPSLWDAIFARPEPAWLDELQGSFRAAEARRSRAKFNTGSISLETGLLLRALCVWAQPQTIVEIGTFIGKSTVSMQAKHIYTCDKDNDCFTSREGITCFPYTTSTQMLGRLVDQGVSADLVFVDGRIQIPDLALLLRLSTPKTIYAFDDATGRSKGIDNLALLSPLLQTYARVEPYQTFAGRTTLALLVPTT